MDDDALCGNGRHEMDYYKGVHSPWNMMPQHLMKEQNSLPMNKKIMSIIAERDAALHERSMALSEKKQAIAERDVALEQRDKAITDRNNALMERDNAIAALQFSSHFNNNGMQNRLKHMNGSETHYNNTREINVSQAVPLSIITAENGNSSLSAKQVKSKNEISSKAPRKKKEKRMSEQDLNRHVNDTSIGTKKLKSEWDSQDLGLNLVNFDETTMPAPVCSCTGVRRQCYKWGSGGWQSSCCTTTLSVYPLPQMQNKRHTRMGGRKMSGSVFTRLLTRAAAAGHDLSIPLDLKDYWLRHGTNAYIIIT